MLFTKLRYDQMFLSSSGSIKRDDRVAAMYTGVLAPLATFGIGSFPATEKDGFDKSQFGTGVSKLVVFRRAMWSRCAPFSTEVGVGKKSESHCMIGFFGLGRVRASCG